MALNTLVLVFSFLFFFVDFGLSQKCMGQSCMIAALVGSTNESFEEMLKQSGGKQPKQKGGKDTGQSCVTKYFKELGLKAPEGFKGNMRFPVPPVSIPRVQSAIEPEFESDLPEISPSEVKIRSSVPDISKISTRQACKQNIFMFARGTTEMGTMGGTVGPALSRALGSSFSTIGISYTADINGIYCIGLPGGVKCLDQLAKVAAKCPTSNIFLGGYSQGAMVVRICAAHSKEDVRKRIKGIVTYGDPFNGASVKGLPNDSVKVFCTAADGVCKGEFSITAGHMAYVGASTSAGAKWLNSRAGGK